MSLFYPPSTFLRMNRYLETMKETTDKTLHCGIIILFLLLAIFLRAGLLSWQLPYYSVDENDIVEPALAFLCGDWDPHWYKYGPLSSYLLAFIYKIWMWIGNLISGYSAEDFFYAAFFESKPFYMVARAFHVSIVLGIAGVSWLFARRYYDHLTSLAALILGLSPFLDLNTNFTIRVDTLVGLFSLLSLFFAVQFGKDKIKFRPYILSGIFAGFAIASKPVAGFLVLPALVFGHFLHVWQDSNLPPGKKIKFAVTRPGLWILVCAVFLAHSLANPYSILNFNGFFLEQYNLFFSEKESAQFTYYHSSYDFSWVVNKWGWIMVITIAASLLTSLRRPDNATRILLVYITAFVVGFLPFKSREYWYNAMFPAVILVVARQITVFDRSVIKYIIDRVRWKRTDKEKKLFENTQYLELITMVLLTMVVTAYPFLRTGSMVYNNLFSPVSPLERRADYAAQLWIEKNLPSHSSILIIGRHAVNLPRITADNPSVQADWGEYFSYHRIENVSWRKKFENAYFQYQQTNRPAYNLLNIREKYVLSSDTKTNLIIRENLATTANDNGCKFVVVASGKNLKGKWEENNTIRLIASFDRSTGHTGDEVKIFEVLQPAVPEFSK